MFLSWFLRLYRQLHTQSEHKRQSQSQTSDQELVASLVQEHRGSERAREAIFSESLEFHKSSIAGLNRETLNHFVRGFNKHKAENEMPFVIQQISVSVNGAVPQFHAHRIACMDRVPCVGEEIDIFGNDEDPDELPVLRVSWRRSGMAVVFMEVDVHAAESVDASSWAEELGEHDWIVIESGGNRPCDPDLAVNGKSNAK